MDLSAIQLRLLTRDCPDIPQLVLINQEAFPPSERASIDGLFDSNDGGNLDMIGIYGEQGLLGFFAVRKLGSIRYLAYFAISQRLKSLSPFSTPSFPSTCPCPIERIRPASDKKFLFPPLSRGIMI